MEINDKMLRKAKMIILAHLIAFSGTKDLRLKYKVSTCADF